MAINPETIQKVEVVNSTAPKDEERLFLYRSAGDKVAIEAYLNENPDTKVIKLNGGEAESQEIEKVVIIQDGKSEGGKPTCIITRTVDAPHGNWKDHVTTYSYGHDRKINCAALGVYVSNDGREEGGAKINSLIERGGAQEAGLQAGDVVQFCIVIHFGSRSTDCLHY
jgi:hypothetical protein